jgi:hypothetical protein
LRLGRSRDDDRVGLEPVFTRATGIGGEPRTRPTDGPIVEVRATLPDGARPRRGRYATDDDAAERAQLLIATGVATRIETVKGVNGRVAVVGPRTRFGSRRNPDRL